MDYLLCYDDQFGGIWAVDVGAVCHVENNDDRSSVKQETFLRDAKESVREVCMAKVLAVL